MKVPLLPGYIASVEYIPADDPGPYLIPRLQDIKWDHHVTLHVSPLGHEIRLESSGELIGYLRESGSRKYAVTVNGICTKVHPDMMGALRELGDLIVAKKTRRRPLGKTETVTWEYNASQSWQAEIAPYVERSRMYSEDDLRQFAVDLRFGTSRGEPKASIKKYADRGREELASMLYSIGFDLDTRTVNPVNRVPMRP